MTNKEKMRAEYLPKMLATEKKLFQLAGTTDAFLNTYLDVALEAIAKDICDAEEYLLNGTDANIEEVQP
jgi:hypothetical protein